MKVKRTVNAVACDGCQYDIPRAEAHATLTVPWEPHAGVHTTAEFHFHAPGSKEGGTSHDCLRYWITGYGIMQRSLRDREWPVDDIDKFVSQMGVRS